MAKSKDKIYKFQCTNNPEHLFEESTGDFWCPLCDISTKPMLVAYFPEEKPVEIIKDSEDIKPKKPRVDDIDKNKPKNENSQRTEDQPPVEKKPIVEQEKKVQIPEITFGNNIWMKEFLNEITFSNCESLMFAEKAEDWAKAKEMRKPAWCYPGFNSSIGKENGILYNFYAVVSQNSIAPEGWRIPSLNEINELLNENTKFFLENHFNKTQNLDLCHRLAMGTYVECSDKRFFWTATSNIVYTAFAFSIKNGGAPLTISQFDKSAGFFIRCIKNK